MRIFPRDFDVGAQSKSANLSARAFVRSSTYGRDYATICAACISTATATGANKTKAAAKLAILVISYFPKMLCSMIKRCRRTLAGCAIGKNLECRTRMRKWCVAPPFDGLRVARLLMPAEGRQPELVEGGRAISPKIKTRTLASPRLP